MVLTTSQTTEDSDASVLEDEDEEPTRSLDPFFAVWSVTVYGSFMTKETVGRAFLLPTDLESSFGFLAGALSWKMVTLFDRAQFELEGQLVKHLGDQRHAEINGLWIGRWVAFPWNHHLGTTIGLGMGLSYATDMPVFEVLTHDRSSQWLIYLLFEATVYPPQYPQWSIVYRIHHRSGMLGTFNGVHGASNALGLGVKYRW
jgi:hypothetical protein